MAEEDIIIDADPIAASDIGPIPDEPPNPYAADEARRSEQEAAGVDLMEQFGWTETRARAVIGLPDI